MNATRSFVFLLLLAACGGTAQTDAVCKKYDGCGCQPYDECVEVSQTEPTRSSLAMPGVRDCLVSSTCESLCAGKPSACTGGAGGGGGGGGGSCGDITCSETAGGNQPCVDAGCGSCYFGHCTLF